MKEETRARREQEKLDKEGRERLLENEDFHRFLKYLYSNAAEVTAYNARCWLPAWIVTGSELYFTDIDGKIKSIISAKIN